VKGSNTWIERYTLAIFFVTAITVRENGGNRHERLSVTVTETVRVEPSGIDRQGKWSFPDGKPSVTIS